MAKATIYNSKGEESGTLELPKNVFETKWNPDLVHQVSVAMDANARNTVGNTKDRADVRGGGIKPWRQKGTGRARHGSSRSPLWRGGGITFGPTSDRNYSLKINRKMRIKALYSLLSKKISEGHILFVESLELGVPKTKEAKVILSKLAEVKGFDGLVTKKRNSALITYGAKNSSLEKSFRNIPNITLSEARNLNVRDILKYKYLVITDAEQTVELLASKLSSEVK